MNEPSAQDLSPATPVQASSPPGGILSDYRKGSREGVEDRRPTSERKSKQAQIGLVEHTLRSRAHIQHR